MTAECSYEVWKSFSSDKSCMITSSHEKLFYCLQIHTKVFSRLERLFGTLLFRLPVQAVVYRLGGSIAASVILASSKLLDHPAVVATIFNGKEVRNLESV